jgi:hypothetical protein
MPAYNLGRGADVFDASTAVPPFTNGSSVSGDNGADNITVHGFNGITISGGNGEDTIIASGESHNISGGRGSDNLTFDGRASVVDGGAGEDVITVINNFGNVFSSNTSIGGAGTDTFVTLNENLFHVFNFGGNELFVDDGDFVTGGFDLIQDFEAGETLDIPASAQVFSPIATASDGFERWIDLGDGQFTAIRGEFLGTGTFEVDSANGTDLLVAWDPADGVDGGVADQGAVVLLGVTDTSGILFDLLV